MEPNTDRQKLKKPLQVATQEYAGQTQPLVSSQYQQYQQVRQEMIAAATPYADLEEEIDEVIETDPDEEDHHPIVDDDAEPFGNTDPPVESKETDYEQEQNVDLAYDSHYFGKNKGLSNKDRGQVRPSSHAVYGNLDDTMAKKRATSAKKPSDQNDEQTDKDISSLKLMEKQRSRPMSSKKRPSDTVMRGRRMKSGERSNKHVSSGHTMLEGNNRGVERQSHSPLPSSQMTNKVLSHQRVGQPYVNDSEQDEASGSQKRPRRQEGQGILPYKASSGPYQFQSPNSPQWLHQQQMPPGAIYMQPMMPVRRRFDYPMLPDMTIVQRQDPAISIVDSCCDKNTPYLMFTCLPESGKTAINNKKARRQQRRNKYEYQSYDNQIFVQQLPEHYQVLPMEQQSNMQMQNHQQTLQERRELRQLQEQQFRLSMSSMKNQISEVIKEEVEESIHSDKRSQGDYEQNVPTSSDGITRKTRTEQMEQLIEEERKRSPDGSYGEDFEEPIPVTIEDRSTPENTPRRDSKASVEPEQPFVIKEVKRPAAAVTSSDEEQPSKTAPSPKPQKTLRYEHVFDKSGESQSNAPIEPSHDSERKTKKAAEDSKNPDEGKAGIETLHMQIQTISDMLLDLNSKYNKDGDQGAPKKSKSKSKSPAAPRAPIKSTTPDKPAADAPDGKRDKSPKEEQMLKRKIKSIKIKRRVTRNKQTTTIRTMEENRTMRRNYRRKNSRPLESKTQRVPMEDLADKPPFLAGRAPPNRSKQQREEAAARQQQRNRQYASSRSFQTSPMAQINRNWHSASGSPEAARFDYMAQGEFQQRATVYQPNDQSHIFLATNSLSTQEMGKKSKQAYNHQLRRLKMRSAGARYPKIPEAAQKPPNHPRAQMPPHKNSMASMKRLKFKKMRSGQSLDASPIFAQTHGKLGVQNTKRSMQASRPIMYASQSYLPSQGGSAEMHQSLRANRARSSYQFDAFANARSKRLHPQSANPNGRLMSQNFFPGDNDHTMLVPVEPIYEQHRQAKFNNRRKHVQSAKLRRIEQPRLNAARTSHMQQQHRSLGRDIQRPDYLQDQLQAMQSVYGNNEAQKWRNAL